MSKSLMVITSKYRLLVPISIKEGRYDVEGQKKLVRENVQLKRKWVEERNKQQNNELYVIDEEASSKLSALRTESIEKQAEQRKLDNVSTVEMLGSLVKGIQGIQQPVATNPTPPTPQVDAKAVEKKALQDQCDLLEIEYSKQAGIPKLKELIANHEK